MASREERIEQLRRAEASHLARHAKLAEQRRAVARELAAIESDMRQEELAYRAALDERRELLTQANQSRLRAW